MLRKTQMHLSRVIWRTTTEQGIRGARTRSSLAAAETEPPLSENAIKYRKEMLFQRMLTGSSPAADQELIPLILLLAVQSCLIARREAAVHGKII
jgi:hypothetical protein